MDDLQQDIYRAPEPGPEKEKELPQFELPPGALRARTWRNTIGFALLMLVIFGLATWLIYSQEKKSEREELADEDAAAGVLMPREGDASLGAPMLVAPEVLSLTEPPEWESLPESNVEIDPQKMGQAMGQMRIADRYLQAKEWDRAEDHVRRALKTWPGMNAAQRMLGVIYTQRGQFDQAIVTLERALKTDPFSAETFNNLATAYMHRGDMAKAEELLQTSIQIRPGYIVAYLNLGLLYLATSDYEPAADYLERAVAEMPGESSIRNNLAVALLRLERYDEARGHLQALIEDSVNTPPAAYFNMAITHALEKDFPEALEWIRQGARHCSPVALQKFLADSDFDGLRGHPEFQSILQGMYPDLPEAPNDCHPEDSRAETRRRRG